MNETFRSKGRDTRQQKVWEENKGPLLEVLRNNPNEWFDVRGLSKTLSLSQPSVRDHLSALVRSGTVEMDDREKPAKFKLRAFYPLLPAYVRKLTEVLKHVPNDLPLDAVKTTVKLSDKTEVTIEWTGRDFTAKNKIILREPVQVADKASVTR